MSLSAGPISVGSASVVTGLIPMVPGRDHCFCRLLLWGVSHLRLINLYLRLPLQLLLHWCVVLGLDTRLPLLLLHGVVVAVPVGLPPITCSIIVPP